MRIISFVTQKGGSGKSTLASCVAVAAHQAGEKVFVIDMDGLGSLMTWSKAREQKNIPVESAPISKLRAVLSVLEKKGVTLVVIDTPGAEEEAVTAASKAADLCIIPARPNAFDLWASEKTRVTLRAIGRDYAFLLNQCPPAQQSARVDAGAAALEAMGGLLTPLVSARVDYQEAARLGLGVTEYAPYGVAAEEMRALWSSIKRRLTRVAAARKAAAEAPKKPVAVAKPAEKIAEKSDGKSVAKPAAKPAVAAKPIAKTPAEKAPVSKAPMGKAPVGKAPAKPVAKARAA